VASTTIVTLKAGSLLAARLSGDFHYPLCGLLMRPENCLIKGLDLSCVSNIGGWLRGRVSELVVLQRMAWRFRKSIKLGPLRLNLSKSGIGTSIGVRGFRVGTDAKGRSYTAASIPGTGLYERKYSGHGKSAAQTTVPAEGSVDQRGHGAGFALGILLLAFMAGGLVVFILVPHSITPPVTPPATVSVPQSPAPPAAVRRRRTHRSVSAAKSARASHVLTGTGSEGRQASPAPTDAVPQTN
jgi:hypothetical protein